MPKPRKSIFNASYVGIIRSLTARRRALGMTQWDLAAAYGEDQSFISRVERFQRRLDVHEFVLFCKILDIAPGVILDPLCVTSRRPECRPSIEVPRSLDHSHGMVPMIAGLILAGGRATRMGGADKAQLELAGRPLISHVIDRLRLQLRSLAISANGDPARFGDFALPVLPDPRQDFSGPLAGILAGMAWARTACPGCRWLLTAPCDAPFLPPDLAQRLLQAIEDEGADLALAASAGRDHPVAGLWPLSLEEALRRALLEEGLRKVGQFAGRYKKAVAEFPSERGIDPFLNLNTPEDLRAAQALLVPTRP